MKTRARVNIYAEGGLIVQSEQVNIHSGLNTLTVDLSLLANGLYQMVISGVEIQTVSEMIIKQ